MDRNNRSKLNRSRQVGRVFFILGLWLGAALPALSQAQNNPDDAELLQRNCMGCHAAGVAGAPRYAERSDWQQRIEQIGWEQLVANGWQGTGRMPAKGYCFQCDKADFERLVRRMVPPEALP